MRGKILVATDRSPSGQHVPIELVGNALTRLLEEGEIEVSVESLGYRSAFVGAVLLCVPGAALTRGSPPRIRLKADLAADAPMTEAAGVDRSAIRAALRQGQTPDQVCRRSFSRRETYLAAIEEEAQLAGELGTFEASEEIVLYLRDNRKLRWERIAARIFGTAGRTTAAKKLYERAKGVGAAERSFTGRGRRFPAMKDEEPD